MKRYDSHRADSRPIEEKALSLLFAMDDAAAVRLAEKLSDLANSKTPGGSRAAMFVAKVKA